MRWYIGCDQGPFGAVFTKVQEHISAKLKKTSLCAVACVITSPLLLASISLMHTYASVAQRWGGGDDMNSAPKARAKGWGWVFFTSLGCLPGARSQTTGRSCPVLSGSRSPDSQATGHRSWKTMSGIPSCTCTNGNSISHKDGSCFPPMSPLLLLPPPRELALLL